MALARRAWAPRAFAGGVLVGEVAGNGPGAGVDEVQFCPGVNERSVPGGRTNQRPLTLSANWG
jgi:hypothetical protein